MLVRGMKNLNHYTHEPASGGSPEQVVVLLHGYGSNGRDLISLAPYWQSALPDALFVSPDAPFPLEIPQSAGYQWFPLIDRTEEEYLEGAEAAAPILNNYLDKLLEDYNLTNDKMALVGFSQGTMMSLYVGPRRNPKIAGILGYSGALIAGEGLNGENGLPIHLIHGENDSVVPVMAYHNAVKVLKEKGFQVGGYTTPRLEHSIDNDGVESGARFLSEILI